MTRTCPNCGNENKYTSKFCESCGTALSGIESTGKTYKETKRESGGIMGWWNKQGNEVKIGSIIGACCLGLILIVGIGGMLSPDATTSTQSYTNTPTSGSSSNTTQQTQTETGGLKVSGLSAHRDSIGNYIIVGEITNNYNTEVSYVQVVGTGYDSSGTVIDSHTTYTDVDTIQPGGKSPFECYLDDPDNKIVKYEVQAQA